MCVCKYIIYVQHVDHLSPQHAPPLVPIFPGLPAGISAKATGPLHGGAEVRRTRILCGTGSIGGWVFFWDAINRHRGFHHGFK